MVCGDDHQGVADVMPGAESVTTELSDAVLTMPVTGKSIHGQRRDDFALCVTKSAQ